MGVFKEEANALETISKNSRRIFHDAADYGVPFKYNDPSPEVKRIFDIISDLKDNDFIVRNRQEWKGGVSVDVVFFWEEDEGYYRGTKYTVSFSHTSKTPSMMEPEFDAMLSVDIEPYMEKA
jgi:hypothetical protein